MYINEAIERADRLYNNEYSREEKYHWCDVVSGELLSTVIEKMSCVTLRRWSDDTFLMPEDCDFTRIEKFIADNKELVKSDMSTFGLVPMYGKDGRFFIKAKHKPRELEVVYRAKHMPIRRISLTDVDVVFGEAGIEMGRECPFITGDSIKVMKDGQELVLHITARKAQFDAETTRLTYLLECVIPDGIDEGETKVNMERIVTDKTVCEAPWDEMYIDYICAQVAFYQQDMDIYQHFISRYNERKEECRNRLKAYAPSPDNVVFRNWW